MYLNQKNPVKIVIISRFKLKRNHFECGVFWGDLLGVVTDEPSHQIRSSQVGGAPESQEILQEVVRNIQLVVISVPARWRR